MKRNYDDINVMLIIINFINTFLLRLHFRLVGIEAANLHKYTFLLRHQLMSLGGHLQSSHILRYDRLFRSVQFKMHASDMNIIKWVPALFLIGSRGTWLSIVVVIFRFF